MTQRFGHEKLIVYQKGIRFVSLSGTLTEKILRRVAACEHLRRAAESIPVNIAHASSTWSAKERICYLGYANGSALESAACLDVLVAKNLLSAQDIDPGKSLLVELVSMLIAMRKTAAHRVCEPPSVYRAGKEQFFDHEGLDVYQAALQLVSWADTMLEHSSCSADLKAKLDKSTTSIVLNIAEGNGRFIGANRKTFHETAFKAAVQSAALIDLAAVNGVTDDCAEQGRDLLRRLAAMLAALSKGNDNDC